jgi:hypothetical protein
MFLAFLSLTGCAAIDVLGELLPKPVPVPLVCGEKTIGAVNEYGETCRLFTDGRYRWIKDRSSIDWTKLKTYLQEASDGAAKRTDEKLKAEEDRLKMLRGKRG